MTLRNEVENALDDTAGDVDSPRAFAAKQILNTWLDNDRVSERLLRYALKTLHKLSRPAPWRVL